MDDSNDIARFRLVQGRVSQAAVDCGRDPAEVRLVCVTKTVGQTRIAEIIRSGGRRFGENRVQEALEKWPDLRHLASDIDLRLIGALQTNQVRDAFRIFDAIESVDRPKLATEIAREMERSGKRPGLFVQVNIGEEPQKAGVLPAEADSFLQFCRKDLGLTIGGLMCIPPVGRQCSPYFALLAKIAARNGLDRLSMGMTSDFELAIQLGATEVRVGSAIFGSR